MKDNKWTNVIAPPVLDHNSNAIDTGHDDNDNENDNDAVTQVSHISVVNDT